MTADQQARECAEKFRRDNGLGQAPLGDIAALIEHTMGLDVTILPVADPDVHGLTMCDPVSGVIRIAAACTGNPMRQRSTLLHEVAHVLFDDHLPAGQLDWSRKPRMESRADAFARHMLVPMGGLQRWLQVADVTHPRESDLSDLVQHHVASPAMVAIQLHAANVISAKQKRTWCETTTRQLAIRFGWSDYYQSLQEESRSRRSPQRLVARLTAAHLAGVVGLAPLARVRGMSSDALQAEFADAGLVPVRLTPARLDSVPFTPASPDELAQLDSVLAEP